MKSQGSVRANTLTVARNAVWNLAGRVVPITIAFAVTPALVHVLGDERWGVFTIVLGLIGTFGIFDFGLGRALTRAVAERLDSGDDAELASLVVTGLMAAAVLGLIGGGTMALLSGAWLKSSLHISAERMYEVRISLYILCASAPIVILNAMMWGVLAAYQRFRAANLINMPVVAMYYVGPLVALAAWNSLIGVMLVLVACRAAMTVAYWRLCRHALPSLRGARFQIRHLRPLVRLGAWMTVSNIMFPLLLYTDRFVIASLLGASDTGYYSTPFDLVARFSIVSIAVMNTAFPAMASSFRSDPQNAVVLFRRSLLAVAIIVFPASLTVVAFSNEVMTLWIGGAFAEHAAPVMRWLGLGILLTCLDAVVVGLLDGIGRPDVNAKFSLLEFALYVPVLIVLLSQFGIAGAAIAWSVRAAVDFLARMALASRLYRPVAESVRRAIPVTIGSCLLLTMPLLANAGLERAGGVVIAEIAFLALLWAAFLTDAERVYIRGFAAALSGLRAGTTRP